MKKNWKDKQKSSENNSTATTKPKKKSKISQIIKDARMSKDNCLNCSQLRYFASKYSNKTAYYDTYKTKTKSKATSKEKGKGKGKVEEKKISNAITEKIATIQCEKIWSLLEDKPEIDSNDYT